VSKKNTTRHSACTTGRVLPATHRTFLSWHRHHFGLAPTVAAYGRMLAHRGRFVSLQTPAGSVWLRPGTTDCAVFDEVFRAQVYALDHQAPRVIVDAGAHIGLTSVYWTHRFPSARIFAIEPHALNFELLCANARTRPRIQPIHGALWRGRDHLRIANPNGRTWSYRVTAGGTIPAFGVADVMADYDLPFVDVLKMDIEGAEIEVLDTAAEWIDRVGTLVIELHERNRRGCEAALARALDGRGFSTTPSGGNLICRRA
jgi:FkbM family methyltransferase